MVVAGTALAHASARAKCAEAHNSTETDGKENLDELNAENEKEPESSNMPRLCRLSSDIGGMQRGH